MTSTPSPSWRLDVLVFVAILALVVATQVLGGAYNSEIGGHPDEPAHYVTGLLIHDYIANGFPHAPMAYAKDYYDHYPKVALGNWPPVFHVTQAAWEFLFSESNTSLLILMAVTAALLATTLFHILQEEFGALSAAAGAIFLVLISLIRAHSMMIMLDITFALYCLLAIYFFGRFLDTEKTRNALLFGLFAAIATMTKGTGVALAIVPPVTLVLTGKWHLLRSPGLWLSAVIVAVLAGPWTWAFNEVARSAWAHTELTWGFFTWAAVFYPTELAKAVGLMGLAFAIYGAFVKLGTAEKRRKVAGIWPAAAALAAGLPLFLMVTPAGGEERYLMPTLAPITMFMIAGISAAANRFVPPSRHPLLWTGALVLVLALSNATVSATKHFSGFNDIASTLLSRPDTKEKPLLIVSDAVGEGQFIATLAMRDAHRPTLTVRRGSKLFAEATWTGRDYKQTVNTPEELMKTLTEQNIGLVVVDNAVPSPLPHVRLVQRVAELEPAHLKLVQAANAVRSGKEFPKGISLYEFVP